jgi:hypothetical protein
MTVSLWHRAGTRQPVSYVGMNRCAGNPILAMIALAWICGIANSLCGEQFARTSSSSPGDYIADGWQVEQWKQAYD